MTNTYRGEVALEIAGKSYDVALTIETLALGAGALGVETLEEFEARVRSLRIADMRPLLEAFLKGNGHEVAPADIARLHFSAYAPFIARVYSARPGIEPQGTAKAEAATSEADPPKAAA